MSLQQGFFANSPQYKNANIANFVLSVPLEMNWTNEVWNFEMQFYYIHWYLISHLLTSCIANEEENCKYMGIESWR